MVHVKGVRILLPYECNLGINVEGVTLVLPSQFHIL
jgi:hypothetical protein